MITEETKSWFINLQLWDPNYIIAIIIIIWNSIHGI